MDVLYITMGLSVEALYGVGTFVTSTAMGTKSTPLQRSVMWLNGIQPYVKRLVAAEGHDVLLPPAVVFDHVVEEPPAVAALQVVLLPLAVMDDQATYHQLSLVEPLPPRYLLRRIGIEARMPPWMDCLRASVFLRLIA